jgi:hypothetical protein
MSCPPLKEWRLISEQTQKTYTHPLKNLNERAFCFESAMAIHYAVFALVLGTIVTVSATDEDEENNCKYVN